MGKIDYDSIIQESENHIRSGHAPLAARCLNQLVTTQVPRHYRLPLALQCRRAGLFGLGLKLLLPVVHPERRGMKVNATPEELAEYSVLLLRFGSQREALGVLSRVDTHVAPNALLYTAYCHFSHWDFLKAIPYLEKYVAEVGIKYWSLVGKVNLAYALVTCQKVDEASALINEVIEIARSENNLRLMSNGLELRAQVKMQLRDFTSARADLASASQLLAEGKQRDNLLIKRWTAILDGLESGNAKPILDYRKKALALRDWDSVRELDRYSLHIKFDVERFNHLVFGTPYPAYNERVCAELKQSLSASSYIFGSANARCMDLATCQVDNLPVLSPGRKCHQVLDVLMRDFYRPVSVGEIFAELFPGDHFDIFTSPGRIHQYLFRIRTWIQENNYPLAIEEHAGFYSLKLTGAFSFRIPRVRPELGGRELKLGELHKLYPAGISFSSREAREKMGISRATFHRLLQAGIDSGAIEPLGSSSTAKYRFRKQSELNSKAA